MENITALEEEYNIINEEDIDDYIPEYIPDYKNDHPSQEDHEQEESDTTEPVETIYKREMKFLTVPHYIYHGRNVNLRNYVSKDGIRWFNAQDIYYMIGKKNYKSIHDHVSVDNRRLFFVIQNDSKPTYAIFINMKGAMELISTVRSDIRKHYLCFMIDTFHTPYVRLTKRKK